MWPSSLAFEGKGTWMGMPWLALGRDRDERMKEGNWLMYSGRAAIDLAARSELTDSCVEN